MGFGIFFDTLTVGKNPYGVIFIYMGVICTGGLQFALKKGLLHHGGKRDLMIRRKIKEK
jgi:hypothetical protein